MKKDEMKSVVISTRVHRALKIYAAQRDLGVQEATEELLTKALGKPEVNKAAK